MTARLTHAPGAAQRSAGRRRPTLGYRSLWSLGVVCLLATASGAADYAAAYLEAGFGSRGVAMGGAFAALADGPAAAYWNPAGLAARQGRALAAGYQPLSLDRTLASLSGAANLRGGLGFGLLWLHAGVDGLQARTNSGEVYGDIEDSENAILFGLGLAPAPGLRLGATVKILRQSIDVAQVGESTANGRGLDLGLQYDLREGTRLALVARNVPNPILTPELEWTVARPSSQTGTSRDDLATELVAGIGHRPVTGLWLAADGHLGGPDPYAAVGASWTATELLSARVGLSRIGADDGMGSVSAGLSVRPMRSEALELHYAYAQDPLDDGARLSMGLSTRF